MKKLDVFQVMKKFDGETIKVSDKNENPMTLKIVLLNYLRSSDAMGLSKDEIITAYQIGCKLGVSDKEVELSTAEYDVIKKIVDSNEVKTPDGKKILIYGIEISQGAKVMVDKAVTVEVPKPEAK